MKQQPVQSSYRTQPITAVQDWLNPVSNILDILNVVHQLSPASMIAASQCWRRKPGQERWELTELNITPDQRAAIHSNLQQLGFIDEIRPKSSNYRYALLLGATLPKMEQRLKHLARLWKKGIQFQQLIFLVGQRPLHDIADDTSRFAQALCQQHSVSQEKVQPLSETEGARLVWQLGDLPVEMRMIPVEFVDTPRVWRSYYWQRANTRDTLITWLANKPAAGKTLVISDQPSASYQLEVSRQELNKDFQPEVAAESSNSNISTALYLDALALWLHNQQNQLM